MSKAEHRVMALLGLSGAFIFSVGIASAGVVQIASPGSTDYFLWSQLGGDQTVLMGNSPGILTSHVGYLASVSLAGDDSILEAVCPAGAGPSAPCSYQTQSSGFAPNDIVLVTSTSDNSTGTGGNGPLTLGFSTGLPSIGAYIQQDTSTGSFEAELMVYDNSTLVGDFTATSDAAGDPVFLGAADPTSSITGAVFSLDSCTSALSGGVSTPCSTADFAIDTLYVGTPEPSTVSMMAGAFLLAGLIGFGRRRRKGLYATGLAVLFCGAAVVPQASAQTADTVIRNLPKPSQSPRAIVKALIPTPEEEASAEALKPRLAAPTLPLWNYTIQSPLDGKTYPGTMVGSNPFVRGARPSTLSIVVVPLIITMMDSGEVFDPTNGLPSQCIFNSEPPGTPLNLVQNSPIFEPEAFTMNGQNIGTYQYIDAFQRANFWSYTSLTGSGYHNTLSPTYAAAMNLTIPAANGTTYDASDSGGCGKYALININYFDAQLKTLIGNLGAAANPSKFVLFLTFNSFVGNTGMPEDKGEVNVPAGCCVFGYHTANTPIAGHNTQTYGFAAWDATNIFPGSEDVSVLAHEVGEWLDDPYVDNLVPPWGNIGQVTGSCYAYLEVGDPLTGVNFPPFTNQGSGYVYHMQELAYYSWFYRQSPSIGAGGAYSNNGTLGTSGAGQLCATPFVFTDIAGNATGPVQAGTQFDLIGAVTTVARTQQIAPVVAPTGTFNILDNSNDDLLCSNVALTALVAPNDNASSGSCGPFNTAGNPWSVGTHQLIIQYNATGNWAGGSFTLNLEITAPAGP